eukprot:COSAG02_NODE_76682_length_132_cov_154.151515_1_plen_33_part_10
MRTLTLSSGTRLHRTLLRCTRVAVPRLLCGDAE